MISSLNEISLECFHVLSFQQNPIPGSEPRAGGTQPAVTLCPCHVLVCFSPGSTYANSFLSDQTVPRGSVQLRFRQQSPALASLQPFLPAPFAAAWLKHYKTILNMVRSDFHTKNSVFCLLVHT